MHHSPRRPGAGARERRPARGGDPGRGLGSRRTRCRADRHLGPGRPAPRGTPGSTLATATGLGPLGRLRLFEPPHTGPNYLLREMVFVIGRKHALKLRLAGFALAVPLGLVLALADGPLATDLAALCHAAGVLVLRWLFFAEAAHVVGLYYGKG